ncbi:MAG: acyltransferase [Cryomorphaceae bacterium]|jgi:peptidoglycan/LPS O-acetylase OafA/YrhL|nr:acyltransferase [Cryomorphaceae bacterium]
MKYIPALDGLRGYAVLLVLLQHWLGNDHFLNFFNNGLIGVSLFYVLSGFLITGILLKNKGASLDVKTQLKNFWARRMLRIFPIYYLLLLILVLIGFQDIRQQLLYFASYTQNILFYSSNQNFGYLIHFWSLAIEEQFYLIWPILILLIRLDRIFVLILLTITAGIFFRLSAHMGILNIAVNPINYHLMGSIDLFGYGAFLAFISSHSQHTIKKVWIFMGSMLAVILSVKLLINHLDYLSLIGVLAVGLIFLVIHFQHLLIKRIFCNAPIIRLGKISYGVYLIHYFMYPFNHWLHELCISNQLKWPFFDVILIPEFSNIYLRFVYFLFLTLFFSVLSWYIIEKPFLNLKSRFAYAK